jgi:hypothetical protein
MYFAEFAFTGTKHLADELLIQAKSRAEAEYFAQAHARNWGIELFSLGPVSEAKLRFYHLLPEPSWLSLN